MGALKTAPATPEVSRVKPSPPRMLKWRYAALIAVAGLAMGAAALAAGQFWVFRVTGPFTYAGLDQVPAREVALVPGVGSAHVGRPDPILSDRLRVALGLYRAHKVGAILVSGVSDETTQPARDEVVEMRRWLTVRGVPREHILSDPGGYRTLDTMWRAANVLHVSGAIVCTQAPNMARSLFLARSAGIDAVGLIAPVRRPPGIAVWRQDALKTLLAIVDTYVLDRKPRVTDALGVYDGRALVAAAPAAWPAPARQ